MTLLATDNRCWGATVDPISVPEKEHDDIAGNVRETEDNFVRQCFKPSSVKLDRSASTSRRSSQHNNVTNSKLNFDTLPLDISWHAPMEEKRRRRVRKHKRTIPKEISFLSSSSVHSDLGSETCSQMPESIENETYVNVCQRDLQNKCICVELLESERFDDNCLGMEHLLSMVNRELVNSSSPGDRTSVAYDLIYNNGEDFSMRLRDILPSFLCRIPRKFAKVETSDTDSTTSLSSSFSSPSLSSNSKADSEGIFGSESAVFIKSSLRLPALQILISSLQLVTRTRRVSRRKSSNSISMDLGDRFWSKILAYMTTCLQDLGANDSDSETLNPMQKCSIEAALVVKGLRLLCKLQPEVMSSYVRYSLLPFVSGALEFGTEHQQHKQSSHKGHHQRQSGDKMLVKECQRLLRSFV